MTLRNGYDSPLRAAGKELAKSLDITKKTGLRLPSAGKRKSAFERSSTGDLGYMMEQFNAFDQLACGKERHKARLRTMVGGNIGGSASPMMKDTRTQNDLNDYYMTAIKAKLAFLDEI